MSGTRAAPPGFAGAPGRFACVHATVYVSHEGVSEAFPVCYAAGNVPGRKRGNVSRVYRGGRKSCRGHWYLPVTPCYADGISFPPGCQRVTSGHRGEALEAGELARQLAQAAAGIGVIGLVVGPRLVLSVEEAAADLLGGGGDLARGRRDALRDGGDRRLVDDLGRHERGGVQGAHGDAGAGDLAGQVEGEQDLGELALPVGPETV